MNDELIILSRDPETFLKLLKKPSRTWTIEQRMKILRDYITKHPEHRELITKALEETAPASAPSVTLPSLPDPAAAAGKPAVGGGIREATYEESQQLHGVNRATLEQRPYEIKKLLDQHNNLGLIVSRRTGKCIGAFGPDGKIRHCAHNEAESPYDIIIKGHMTPQEGLHHMGVMGQCINKKGMTVGVLVRHNKRNHYVPTVPHDPKKDSPILAHVWQS